MPLTAALACTRPPNVQHGCLLQSRDALPDPSVNRARSRGASVLRTHAPAAALHARRSTPKGVSRRRSACGSSAHGLQNGESAQMEAGPGWTVWMRDKTASAPAPSLAQPAAPAPAPAAPPPPAPSSPDVRMRSPSGSAEKRLHHTPDSRASQTPATPPSAPKTKRRKPGAVAAALAAAATPQAHTATSEAAPDPTPPPPPPTSPPSASWPALPTRTGHGPETNIPAWGRECRPPQG